MTLTFRRMLLTYRRLVAGLAAFMATAAMAAGPLNLNYTVTNGWNVGVSRAFDDGTKTVLVLVDPKHDRPTLTRMDGTKINYKVVDQYAVLPTLEHALMAYAKGEAATIAYGAVAIPVPASHTASAWAPMPGEKLPTPTDVAASGSDPSVATALSWNSKVATPVAAEKLKPKLKPAPLWTIRSGEMLSDVLARWCATAHWQKPQWGTKYDYKIKADASFEGDMVTAITTLMKAYQAAAQLAIRSGDVRADDVHLLHAAVYERQRLIYVNDLTTKDTP